MKCLHNSVVQIRYLRFVITSKSILNDNPASFKKGKNIPAKHKKVQSKPLPKIILDVFQC
jgi:hypothetical protein